MGHMPYRDRHWNCMERITWCYHKHKRDQRKNENMENYQRIQCSFAPHLQNGAIEQNKGQTNSESLSGCINKSNWACIIRIKYRWKTSGQYPVVSDEPVRS